MITDKQKQEFIAGYLTAALWSSADTITDAEGEERGVNLDDYDWADGEAEKLHADCYDFMQENERLLERYARREASTGDYTTWELAGHDFWLTRCGHGVGYWARGFGALGDLLTKRCGHGTPYPSLDLYLSDDELVCADVHPTAYIVETRNMHTAGHEWSVYSSLTDAHLARKLFEEGCVVAAEEKRIGWESINFRKPLAYWYLEPGNILHRVRVINPDNIPDVY